MKYPIWVCLLRCALRDRPLTEPYPATNQDELANIYRDLFLPVLVAEYKKEKETYSIQGPNQVRSYTVAALKFLAICGIEEFLIFNLYTEGTVGVVQAGWEEKEARYSVRISDSFPCQCLHRMQDIAKGGTHLLDRNCQAFDISNVLGAFNLAIFLAKLAHQHVPRLLNKFEESKQLDLAKRLREAKDVDLKWKHSHQMEEPAFNEAKKKAKAADKKHREQEIEAGRSLWKVGGFNQVFVTGRSKWIAGVVRVNDTTQQPL
jgi:hypothetical protein